LRRCRGGKSLEILAYAGDLPELTHGHQRDAQVSIGKQLQRLLRCQALHSFTHGHDTHTQGLRHAAQ
jgi:hypothetical protein